MRKFTLLLSIVATLISSVACTPKKCENIIIISTSDIHSKVDMLPRLATLIEQAHAQDTAKVFVVDAGDRWTGNPFVDMAPHAGRPIIEQMNRLGYDVATYGNHEFDMGLDTLQKRVEDAYFPLVLANVNTGTTVWQQPEPYVILPAGDIKVGFLGLVTAYAGGHPDGDDEIFVGTEFFSPEWSAERYGAELREKCDVMVVLSHCGLDRDTTNVASAFPMADLIVSGHTHETYAGKAGNVAVVQGLNKLRFVGLTTMKITNGKPSDIKCSYVALPEEENARVKEEVEAYRNVPFLTAPIGTLTQEASKMGLAHMMADEGRKVAGTDLGFYHIGGTRLGSLAEGNVSRADIYELEPFQSYMVTTTMTLKEIEEMIINKFNDTTNQKESHRVDLIPSGLHYTIVTDSKGDAVKVKFRPEVHKKIYTVAIADYVYGNKVYAYSRRPATGRTELVTTYLLDRLAEGPYTPDNTPRGNIVKK